MELSDDQEAVVDSIREWRNGMNQTLTVGGYAGTGKTTIISYLVEAWKRVKVAALCGKAAHVLRSKGVYHAQTLHSMLYIPYEDRQGKVRYRRRKSFDEEVDTIIVDEASMLDHLINQDLLALGIPVLYVGDHGQLEPIGTNPNLMKDPQLKLETIHRQSRDNPILRLATAFREGRPTPYWKDPAGRLNIVSRREFMGLITPDAQMICGFNKTRHEVNKLVRKMLGHEKLVCEGEKLICLKNNKEFGIFNGQQFTVRHVGGETRATIHLDLETDDGATIGVSCRKEQFGINAIEEFKVKDVALMDYGYCLTAHKSQGSEWSNVLALDEVAKAWNPKRWRYTVATRAKDRLTYCM